MVIKTVIALAFALLVTPLFAESGTTYLALGDSVAFGMNPLLLPPYSPSKPSPKPKDFIGYPEILAAVAPLLQNEVNASCPGETSASFLDTKALDFGCNSPHPDPPFPPFKTTIGLHAKYTVAQMDFAESQLKTNAGIHLVTLTIGANDVFLVLPQLQACGDSACVNTVLTPVLLEVAGNLTTILTRIRALYKGTLVLTTYYSPSPVFDALTVALNDVITQVGTKFGAKFADGFTAFQVASAPFNHDACRAGLLIRLPPGAPTPCDIHPSQLGQALVTATILAAK